MHDKSHRLDTVDDELEIGFDQRFEKRWRRLEVASHGIMLLFALAALVGLFGKGPLSHRTHQTADGRLAVDFEPLARWGTSTQVTVHLSGPPSDSNSGAATPARLFVDNALVEPLGLQQVIPQPMSTKALRGGAVYEFDIPPGQGSAAVRFILKPATVGLVTGEVRQGGPDGEALSWRELVLP